MMFESTELTSCCSHPEALVVINVVPLCGVDTPEGLMIAAAAAKELASPFDPSDLRAGRPLRCVAALSCSEALALVKEAGHVLL